MSGSSPITSIFEDNRAFVQFIVGLILFFLLSPGLILTLPPSPECDKQIFGAATHRKNKATSYFAIIAHTLVYAIVFALAHGLRMKLGVLQSDVPRFAFSILLAPMLFMLLSPGFLITLPPKQTIVLEKTEEYDPQKKPKTTHHLWRAASKPCATSYPAIKTHTQVFAVIFVVAAAYIETNDFVDKWFFSTKLS